MTDEDRWREAMLEASKQRPLIHFDDMHVVHSGSLNGFVRDAVGRVVGARYGGVSVWLSPGEMVHCERSATMMVRQACKPEVRVYTDVYLAHIMHKHLRWYASYMEKRRVRQT